MAVFLKQIRDNHAHEVSLEPAKQWVFVFDALIMDVCPWFMRYAMLGDFR
jgi:hypothetical protein